VHNAYKLLTRRLNGLTQTPSSIFVLKIVSKKKKKIEKTTFSRQRIYRTGNLICMNARRHGVRTPSGYGAAVQTKITITFFVFETF